VIEFRSKCGRISTFFCTVFSCIDREFAMDNSTVQEVLPHVQSAAEKRSIIKIASELVSIIARFSAAPCIRFQIELFWIVMPCDVVVGYQLVRGPCCQRLKTEVALTSEALLSYQNTIRRHNPEFSPPWRPENSHKYSAFQNLFCIVTLRIICP
jgi:hypothetical protein